MEPLATLVFAPSTDSQNLLVERVAQVEQLERAERLPLAQRELAARQVHSLLCHTQRLLQGLLVSLEQSTLQEILQQLEPHLEESVAVLV